MRHEATSAYMRVQATGCSNFKALVDLVPVAVYPSSPTAFCHHSTDKDCCVHGVALWACGFVNESIWHAKTLNGRLILYESQKSHG